MATFDFRILLETVEGNVSSYISSSFVDTDVDLVLSASQVYNRITGSVSCSYQNQTNFNGSFNTGSDLTFKNNKLKYKNAKKIKIDQLNKKDLKRFIIKNKLKNKIDLVSDDGAHLNEHIINSFEVLFPSLRKGGYYFIEDINLNRNKNPRIIEITAAIIP